ncbi:GL14182 [Drosophila persimilis]|uniref:GL14182 n=1 Tax=Drosophila persimilis TaxID=7234 RepID=B4GTY6_DROPE|nr:GL14182 [Drosophila persimilis]
MASSNVSDWDEPLPTSSLEEAEEEDPDYCSPSNRQRRQEENVDKLRSYVRRMAYQPSMPPKARPSDVTRSQPRMQDLMESYARFKDVYDPKLRAKRIKRMLGKYNAITTEQLGEVLKSNEMKERRKEDFLKRKQELYYNMLTKLERQCRTQYLNRGIFCNILLAIGVQPTSQSAIYYTSQDAIEYDVCHRLAHALLSLVIKALDSAATRDPNELAKPVDMDLEMDNHIKRRLMCAAEKKISYERRRNRQQPTFKKSAFDKCSAPKCG